MSLLAEQWHVFVQSRTLLGMLKLRSGDTYGLTRPEVARYVMQITQELADILGISLLEVQGAE